MRKMYILGLAVLMTFLVYSPITLAVPPVTDGLVLQLDASDVNTTTRSGVTYVTSWNDLSGNGNNATMSFEANQPTLVSNATPTGGSAVKFDGGNDYLSIVPNSTFDGGTLTIFMVHSNGAFGGAGTKRMINFGYADVDPCEAITTAGSQAYSIAGDTSDSGIRALARNKTGGQLYAPIYNPTTNPAPAGMMVLNTFYIAAVSYDGVTTESIKAYLTNAAGDACSVTTTGLNSVGTGNTVVYIGCGTSSKTATTPAVWFNGSLCEVLVYNRILDDTEKESVVSYLRNMHLLLQAKDPTPANSGSAYDRRTNLEWTPADNATSQTLYFSSDQDSVVNSDSSALKATLTGTDANYAVDSLQLSTKYYWRIKSVVNGSTYPGSVWNFSLPSYYVIDNFEKYVGTGSSTIPGSLRAAWADGYSLGAGNQLGSNIALVNEVNNVSDTIYDGNTHSGAQSILFAYDNTGNAITFNYPAGPVTYTPAYRYSEAKIDISTLAIGTDWTIQGSWIMKVYFSGKTTNNTNAPLYIAVEDATGHISTPVVYPTSSDIAVPSFHTWEICSSDLATNGVNLANLSKLYIGFGDRNNPQVGGKGVVYIDDFRMYRQPKSAADLNQDCHIDFKDFDLLIEDWLKHAGCVN